MEPYFVIEKRLSPSYDERFLQRFYNKVAYALAVHMYG